MIHVLGGAESDNERFHHTAQKGVQFKTYEMFILGIFHLIFFVLWLSIGNQSHGKQNQIRRTIVQVFVVTGF